MHIMFAPNPYLKSYLRAAETEQRRYRHDELKSWCPVKMPKSFFVVWRISKINQVKTSKQSRSCARKLPVQRNHFMEALELNNNFWTPLVKDSMICRNLSTPKFLWNLIEFLY